MSNSRLRFKFEDHLCRDCGGRVVQATGGHGPTGGGNPIYMCADCERGGADMGPSVVCWCGFSMKGSHGISAYTCLPFSILKVKPWLRQAFLACGSDPDSKKAVVGVVTWSDLKRFEEKAIAEGLT